MPTLLKLKKAKSGKTRTKGSAIDSAQRELLERQNQIEAQIKAIQASLEGANARPARQTRTGDQAFSGTAPRGQHTHRTTMSGGRQVTVVPAEPVRRVAPRRPTMLRAERIAARRQTMALIVCLAGAVMYALSHLLP